MTHIYIYTYKYVVHIPSTLSGNPSYAIPLFPHCLPMICTLETWIQWISKQYVYIHIHTHHIPIFRCPFFKRLPRLSNRCRNSGKRDPQLAPSMSGSTRLSFLPVSVNEGWRVGSRSESLGWCT